MASGQRFLLFLGLWKAQMGKTALHTKSPSRSRDDRKGQDPGNTEHGSLGLDPEVEVAKRQTKHPKFRD